MNKVKPGFKNLYLPIFFILFIGSIGVQILTSCSSDDNGESSSSGTSSSSIDSSSSSSSNLGGNSSSDAVIDTSSSSSTVPSSSSVVLSSSSVAKSSSSSVGLCAGFINGTEREHYGQMKEQFCDERDGKKYVYVTIGSGETAQTWMAENLNCNINVESSKCYGNLESNCEIYGRLYDWATAMTVCPDGWHIPDYDEFLTLYRNAGGAIKANTNLKATSGWRDDEGEPANGTDQLGFSALPGGSGASFNGAGRYGYWWFSTEYDKDNAYFLRIKYNNADIDYNALGKARLFSVRCVKDD